MKKCPYCAEDIQDAAIVCRYCGRDLPEQKNVPATQENKQATKKLPSVGATGAKIAAVFTILAAIGSVGRYSNAPAELVGSLTIGAFSNFIFWWIVCSFFVWVYRKITNK